MVKRKRFAPKIAKLESNEIAEDRISEMPPDIIISILSSLPMGDAVSTSVLSSRWRGLWKRSILDLNFDATIMRGCKSYKNYKCGKVTLRVIHQQRRDFVRRVNQFLLLHQVTKIDTFRVHFYLGKKFAAHIDRWVDFAIQKGVEKLDLNLEPNLYRKTTKSYAFPSCLFAQGRGSNLKYLSLSYCILKNPYDLNSFKSLRTLSVKDVDLGEGIVENLFSNLLLLESLRLVNCSDLVELKILFPVSKLKHLTVLFCGDLLEIGIYAPNLITFEYIGEWVEFNFGDVPLLINVLISITGVKYAPLRNLGINVPQLETLHLTLSYTMKLPKVLPTFHHLKHLMLTVHTPNDRRILWMTDLLRASPYLQKFQLAVYAVGGLDKEEKELMRLPKCPHYHLKTVELGGFRGDPNEMEVAVYILNNCVALETMLIDPRPQGICIYSNTWVVYGRARKAWSKFRREKVKEQLLKEEVTKSVEVILL